MLSPSSATQLKVENGVASMRRGEQPWQPIDGDVSGSFAPNGDFMAFLAGAKHVVRGDQSTHNGTPFTRYTFDLDGPGYAAYMRDQLQSQLRPGVTATLPEVYLGMSGTGELWVRADGLPLRQVIAMQFPAQGDSSTTAAIAVDFFDYAAVPPSLSGSTLAFQAEGLRSALLAAISSRPDLLLAAIMVLMTSGCMVLMVRYRRSRPLYAVLSLYVIIALEGAPLLQAHAVAAASADLAARAQQQQSQQQQQADLAALQQEQQANAWNPQQSPLDSARSAASAAPLAQPAAPCADPADADGDTLTDCEEALLGTSPGNPDTDEDGLTDAQEVGGFQQGGQRWYSDPLKQSTLYDSIADGQKCASFPSCPDSDGDGTPDMFDRDIDGDSVPNSLDNSPFRSNEHGL